MAQKGRWFRPKPKSLIGSDFDSMLEKRIHDVFGEVVQHHPPKIDYVQTRTYEPDFLVQCGEGNILVECKGYFQDRNDCTKYPHIRNSILEGDALIFVFEDPDKPIHFQAKRKDNSRMTHGEWCIKNKFVHYPEWRFLELLSGGSDALYKDVMERTASS